MCGDVSGLAGQDKESQEAWEAMAAGVAELCCGLAAEVANGSLVPEVRLTPSAPAGAVTHAQPWTGSAVSLHCECTDSPQCSSRPQTRI